MRGSLPGLCGACGLLLLLAACRSPADGGPACAGVAAAALELPGIERSTGVSRRNLAAWVETLASPRLAGRHAGDPGAREAAALLAARMAQLGLAPPWEGGYCQPFPYLDGTELNVVGHLAADGGRPVILVGAHYDGQGLHPSGRHYPGADDNASGVAALLEVARLAGKRPNGRAGWVFAAFGGEEVGQQGARAYLASPSLDLARVELAVHLDMVGRQIAGALPGAIGYLTMDGPRQDGDHEALGARLRRAAQAAGVELVSLADLGAAEPTISDAEVFGERLPAVLLSTGLHADHHQFTDTPERLDLGQIERAARLALALGI